jgi:hypothetical protein
MVRSFIAAPPPPKPKARLAMFSSIIGTVLRGGSRIVPADERKVNGADDKSGYRPLLK